MAASGSAHVVLDDTIGIFEVGSAFAIFLFGIVTLQAHCYYTTFRDDGWMQKTMVSTVAVCEFVERDSDFAYVHEIGRLAMVSPLLLVVLKMQNWTEIVLVLKANGTRAHYWRII